MNITIVGGGNIGTQLAVHCACKGHMVTVFTSKPDRFSRVLYIVDETGRVMHEAKICQATNDGSAAFSKADLIFVTMPAYCMENIAEQIYDYVRPGTMIGLIPGTGGGECAFKSCMEKGCIIFGIQRVPSVARLVTYGQKVCASGYRKELFLAALPAAYTQRCCQLLSDIMDMPCIALPNYLNVTLTPSNPILHTTRLRTLFSDFKEGKFYDRVPLFYEEWSDDSSELLIKCDEEVQGVCRAMKEFDLSYVRSLKEHYESDTVSELTNKLRSIESLKGIKTPVISEGNKFIPDLSSRYFTADFPYGLSILKQLADFMEVEAVNIAETLEWYYNLSGNRSGFSYHRYGIDTYEALKCFYLS